MARIKLILIFFLFPGNKLEAQQKGRQVNVRVTWASAEGIQIDSSITILKILENRACCFCMSQPSTFAPETHKITLRGSDYNNTPLYVLDGKLIKDLSKLNPDNIKSIEVLNDADAWAAFGSRTANGVIIITSLKARHSKHYY